MIACGQQIKGSICLWLDLTSPCMTYSCTEHQHPVRLDSKGHLCDWEFRSEAPETASCPKERSWLKNSNYKWVTDMMVNIFNLQFKHQLCQKEIKSNVLGNFVCIYQNANKIAVFGHFKLWHSMSFNSRFTIIFWQLKAQTIIYCPIQHI